MNTRLIAAKIVNAVTDGVSLSDALARHIETIKDKRDRALVQAICFGVCRYYARLDVILSSLLTKPMQGKDGDVHALLLVGLYQLIDMRVPEHAAVSETVNAAGKLKKSWARGFVNAILRSYLRRKDEIQAGLAEDEEAYYAHPAWWIHKIRQAWPTEWREILTANNEHPPFSLRVNLHQQTREQAIAKLKTYSEVELIPYTQTGIVLSTPVTVDELPDFSQGGLSVQDGAAQLAAELLVLEPNQRVLDACAAPGGKLMHILEAEPALAEVIAVEKDKERIKQIEENLQRLHDAKTKIHCADATKLQTWWDEQPFDRILLDAPCSASGVIRRHPDIKLLRQPNDFRQFAQTQKAILAALWQTLKPGGILLYVTCSIFPEENVEVIKDFLATHPDAKEYKIEAEWGVACEVGRQILPGTHGMDGFYYARLQGVSV